MASPPNLRLVTSRLLEVTGLTIAELARQGEVHRPNCLAWLSGKEQVFSEKNQYKVCERLGWRFGRLRRDMVHRWEIGNDLSACKEILTNYEDRDSGTTLMIFQAEGAATEGAAVIIGLSQALAPLVILIRRPLGYVQPTQINAEALGRGFNEGNHPVSAQEWQQCWLPESAAPQPSGYLETYGQTLLDVAENDLVLLQQSQGFADAFEDEYASILNQPVEQQQWLLLLARAVDAGMSFEEILVKVETALGLERP